MGCTNEHMAYCNHSWRQHGVSVLYPINCRIAKRLCLLDYEDSIEVSVTQSSCSTEMLGLRVSTKIQDSK